MSEAQAKTYELFRSAGWDYHGTDDDGIITMKYNTSSIMDSFTWRYLTIDKDGVEHYDL